MKVLLIDDEDDLRRIALLSLSRIGEMDVLEARDGRTGLALAREESVDGILLDVMMPELDGPSVLRLLREDDATRRIPVIFLTANAMPAEIARLSALGVAGVLTKPFDPVALPANVRKILSAASTSKAEPASS